MVLAGIYIAQCNRQQFYDITIRKHYSYSMQNKIRLAES